MLKKCLFLILYGVVGLAAGHFLSSIFFPKPKFSFDWVSQADCNQATTLSQRSVTLLNRQGEGSGLLLDGEYVLTAAHVANDNLLYVEKSLDSTMTAKATFMFIDPDKDLALVKISNDFKLAPLPVSETTVTDTQAMWYSHRQNSLKDALLLNVHSAKSPNTQAFTDLSVPGDSGSVLLTCKGLVAGVIVEGVSHCREKGESVCKFIASLSVKGNFVDEFLQTSWPNYPKRDNGQ